ncbi:MAG: hypothetical protein GXO47_14015 [Chlorobi bacterium]|nr:hypothetical protein [Chlorobiota bacterium]
MFELEELKTMVAALWELDEDDCEINQKFFDADNAVDEMLEHCYKRNDCMELNKLKKELELIHDEYGIVSEKDMLNMMYPDGIDD